MWAVRVHLFVGFWGSNSFVSQKQFKYLVSNRHWNNLSTIGITCFLNNWYNSSVELSGQGYFLRRWINLHHCFIFPLWSFVYILFLSLLESVLINYFYLIKVLISSSFQIYLHKVEQSISYNAYNYLFVFIFQLSLLFCVLLLSYFWIRLPNHWYILFTPKVLALGFSGAIFFLFANLLVSAFLFMIPSFWFSLVFFP